MIAVAAAATTVAPAFAASTGVFYCGQSFRGTGVLMNNLDCSGFGGSGVTIERGRLDLNGFSITNAGQYGLLCLTTCQVKGPGTISGHGLDGVHSQGWIGLRDLIISNNVLDGVYARNVSRSGRVTISDSRVTNNGFNGIEADSSAVLRRTVVRDNGEQGVDVGMQDCESTGRVLLFRSNVLANGATCSESPVCGDLNSCGRNQRSPVLRSFSQCNKSYVRGSSGATWGVCLQD
jgi:hypothetical protein